MAIVEMKKLTLLALKRDREKLMRQLQKLGCVQIVEGTGGDEALAPLAAQADPREAQLRMIRDGEAMALENRLQLNDEHEENQPDSGEEE